MLISFLFVFLSVYGFGLACPVARAGLGVRLAFGWSALVVLLCVGAGLLGLPVRLWSFVVAGLALAVLLARRRRIPLLDDLTHPGAALLGIAAIAFAIGPGAYQPVSGDELGGWLLWARQITAANAVAVDAYGYTMGWPLLLAFPQAFVPAFDEALAFAPIVVLHSAALALIADFVRHLVLDRGAGDRHAALAAWATVALVLATEGMWTFFPSALLIEKPQIYAFVSTLILAAWMAETADATPTRRAIVAGAAFAATYLIKVAAVTLAPALALAIMAMAWKRKLKDAAIAGAVLMAPVVVLMAWWGHAFKATGSCLTDPFAVVAGFLNGSPEIWTVAGNLAEKLGAYYAGYKLPVTAVAAIGFVLAARQRAGILLAAMIAVLSVVYLTALFFTYVSCWGPESYTTRTLISYERYGRVILRVFHAIGLALLVSAISVWWRRRSLAVDQRAARAAFGSVLAVFLVWQGNKAHATLKEIATRANDGERGVLVAKIRAGSERILRWTEARPLLPPPAVFMVVQKGTGFELNIANYYGAGAARGKPAARFTVQGPYSFGPTQTDTWMVSATPDRIARYAEAADILWPVVLDDYARDALAPILSACPGGDILVRTGAAWACLDP